jgi:hypothetical protein
VRDNEALVPEETNRLLDRHARDAVAMCETGTGGQDRRVLRIAAQPTDSGGVGRWVAEGAAVP